MSSNLPILKIKCHREGMDLPKKAHLTDAGLDLTAYAVEQKGGNVFFFDSGISLEIPSGYFVEVFPRSSISKTDFVMANSVGVIDPDYRGIVYVPFRYLGIHNGLSAAQDLLGKRFAQMILKRLEPYTLQVVEELTETSRSSGGFGSSGY